MSGGHFEYNCFRISQFAEDLQHELDINCSEERDNYNDPIGSCYEPETIEMLINAQAVIAYAGKISREIEWLYSGDHGEESFRKIVNNIIADIEKKL